MHLFVMFDRFKSCLVISIFRDFIHLVHGLCYFCKLLSTFLVLFAAKAYRLCNSVSHIIMQTGDKAEEKLDETLILEVLAGGGKVGIATLFSITIALVSLLTE